MSFVIHRKALSCNYDLIKIKVEFLVIHYTSVGLSKTLEIFQNPTSKASSHLVVDRDGAVYELVSCLENSGCFKAWHAGDSVWEVENKNWEQFNNFSIGVELVNKNGNLCEYTKEQYHSLQVLMQKLKDLYPHLRNPERVLGHEHIAGYRGKVDPGYCFNWSLFFNMNYSEKAPLRKPVLSEELLKMFSIQFPESLQKPEGKTDEDWMKFNTQLECFYRKQIQVGEYEK